jgi:hypothetical protein
MTSDTTGTANARAGNVFLAFLPWIVFAVVSGPSTWEYAALAALLTSVVLAVPDLRARRLKLLDVVSVAFFALMTVLALFLGRGQALWLETYAQVIASGVLAVVALGSLAFTPFTEAYAREQAPRELWGTPAFKHTNRVLTAVWGLVFLATAVLGVLALKVSGGGDWLNWVIPVALLVLAVKFTEWYPEQVRARVRGQQRVH